ncbi:uncharacterized protein A1O9_12461 [Exophiala aquamarina CBS 119918]|uniref:D-serine dehydratase-like domain-containing protein n=1 Tax=Exophiala aquamarina CBS 119918 TaxID=1182545 RepID=A0A072NUJ0_9EURO|nr:uncharacterized protein A1O9_12461 [Exophiala aquamarina CBS 119918]KEF51544.1 hypothetical protein A1O9_12461 [Exophiala aquamarina CBS 119918]
MSAPASTAPKVTKTLVDSSTGDSLPRDPIGLYINHVAKPAVLLNRATMQRHCESLRSSTERLGIDFRFHVKTHKTRQGLRLQAGESNSKVRLVVSTVAELEYLLPVLLEFQDHGRHVNVLYGMPLPLSQVGRLATLGRQLGPSTISVLVDNVHQLDHVKRFNKLALFPAGLFLKIDTGYHRAGLPPDSVNQNDLVKSLMQLHEQGEVIFTGLYSHSSLSYNDTTPDQAMENLEAEISGCLDVLHLNGPLFSVCREMTISVGASPQVTSIENLAMETAPSSAAAVSLRKRIEELQTGNPSGFQTSLELHAGVYSVLDIQQMSTRSRGDHLGTYEDEIAVSVAAEVCSIYNDGERQQSEALVAVGTLGLGREPCVAYSGWGVVDCEASLTPDNRESHTRRRLIVSRISQEHSIISWERSSAGECNDAAGEDFQRPIPLAIGQTVRIYPNHACVTGALYPHYLVVDSSDESQGRKVVDVWERARGW